MNAWRLWPSDGHTPLRSRLRLMVAGALALTVLVLFLLVGWLELRSVQEQHRERALSTAAVLAENLRGSLAFYDVETANRTLASVNSLPGIRWAALLGIDRRLFTDFVAPGRTLPAPVELAALLRRVDPLAGKAVSSQQGGAVDVVQPVLVDGEPVGWLLLELDAENPSLLFLGRIAAVMLAACVIGLIGSIGAVRVLERIAQPIVDLAAVMREVSGTHDYRLRLMSGRSDEIGQLHEGFNGLLEQLELRDHKLAAQQQHLLLLATRDEVTKLSNRHHFRQLLDAALERVDEAPFALLCLDLDRFKNVNDSLGHDMGDQVLRMVGERLRGIARTSDTMARTGGDEFSLILGDIQDEHEALQVAGRVLHALRQPFQVDGLVLHLGASLGLALAPRDATAAESLIKNADLALYASKAGGRDALRVYQPALGSQVDRRLVLEQELREALARGQLSIVYQPQIETRDHTVVGLEALLRWNHPELGAVAPIEFIPIAEDSGLIVPLGAWVLEQACLQVQRLEPQRRLSIAVNLSPVQIMTQDLPALIDGVLARTGIEPDRLDLEITESVLLNDEEATLEHLSALQRRGVQIVLDDFGTGFASMAYLLRFQFQKIKIDRSFVRSLREHEKKRAIVRAIIDMSRHLGTRVLAEGVETESELQMLAVDGCTEVQGYLYARPLGVEELTQFLHDWERRAQEAALVPRTATATAAEPAPHPRPDLLLLPAATQP